jgi:Fur family ferric uptake transcriptional regulator
MIAATQSNHPLAAVAGKRSPQEILEESCARIRTSGMRVTKPRIALVESLLKQDGPVSIERLHQAVGIKACDLVTIYRCLAAFETLGLVRRSYLHNGTCLYELTAGGARRYHVVCKACGRTDPLDFTFTSDAEQKLQDKGYAQISHVLEFFGVCPACQQASKPERATSVEVPAAE